VLTVGKLNRVGLPRAVRSPALCAGIMNGKRVIGVFGGMVGAAASCKRGFAIARTSSSQAASSVPAGVAERERPVPRPEPVEDPGLGLTMLRSREFLATVQSVTDPNPERGK